MIKVTFKEPTFVFDGAYSLEANFVFVHKVIFEKDGITPIINWDRLFISIKNESIRSIEHVKPTEL